MRWLTVNVPGQPDREVLLEKPGPPRLSDEIAEQVRDLLTKGATGGFLIFGTDDCRKTYDELRAKGVEFTMEPCVPRPGIKICFLRGPQGISIELLDRDPKYA